MEIKNRLTDIVKNPLKSAGRAGLWTLEKTSSYLAVPAAVLSTAHTGNYFVRGLEGYWDALRTIYGVSESVIKNEGVRTFLGNGAQQIGSYLTDIAYNLKHDSEVTAYVAIGTLVAGKAIPFVSRKTNTFLRKRKQRKIRRKYS